MLAEKITSQAFGQARTHDAGFADGWQGWVFGLMLR
jgi:hypothetical protein